MNVDYLTGLDVGQAHDFTAAAVLERTTATDGVSSYAVRHLERFAPGTAYTDVAALLAKWFRTPPLRGSLLVVDLTAVGRPVLDLLRRSGIGGTIRSVAVTGGHQAGTADLGGWLVPKKELVSVLQLLLQSRRLKVAPSLREAETLVQELANFQVKVSLKEEEASWRERPHDDLVLATAIAAWVGERCRPFRYAVASGRQRRDDPLGGFRLLGAGGGPR